MFTVEKGKDLTRNGLIALSMDGIKNILGVQVINPGPLGLDSLD